MQLNGMAPDKISITCPIKYKHTQLTAAFKPLAVNVIYGPASANSMKTIVQGLASTVQRRMQILAALSGIGKIDSQLVASNVYVSATQPIVLCEHLPTVDDTCSVAEFLSKALSIDFQLATSACPICSQPLLSTANTGLIAQGLLLYHADCACSIGVQSQEAPEVNASHVILGVHELAADDPELQDVLHLKTDDYFLVLDRLRLTATNNRRLLQAIQSNYNRLRILIGVDYIDIHPDAQQVCVKCLKNFSSSELASAGLTLHDWLQSKIGQSIVDDVQVPQLVPFATLVQELDLNDIPLNANFSNLSRPTILRLLYLDLLLKNYTNKLLILDLPWLPGYQENRSAENYFLDGLNSSHNTVIACSAQPQHLSSSYNLIKLEDQSGVTRKTIFEQQIEKANGLYNTNSFSCWQSWTNKPETELLEHFAAKRVIWSKLDSRSKLSSTRIIDFSDLNKFFSELYARLPRAREQGLQALQIRKYLKVPADHNKFNTVKFKEVALDSLLKLSITEAYNIFSKIPKLARILKLIETFGLGELVLEQPLAELAHSELRRFKLARELAKAPRHSLIMAQYPALYLSDQQAKELSLAIGFFLQSSDCKMFCIEDNLRFISSCQVLEQ